MRIGLRKKRRGTKEEKKNRRRKEKRVNVNDRYHGPNDLYEGLGLYMARMLTNVTWST